MSSTARYLRPEVIEQVARLDLRARFIVEGFLAGLHRSPFQGLSSEFREHRRYCPGDDPRSIDWNVFARTDRLMVRRHAAETNLSCHLLIDASASMGYVGPSPPLALAAQPAAKLAYAIDLAAALGYLVSRRQDAVGLGILRDGLETLRPPRSRRSDYLHLLATLAALQAAGSGRLCDGIEAALQRVSHRGVIVLLSDLLTETEPLLRLLHQVRARGHDLIVMHILDAVEVRFELAGPLRLEDPETDTRVVTDAELVAEAYRRALDGWRTELAARLSRMRADYVPLDTAQAFDAALVGFLTRRARRR